MEFRYLINAGQLDDYMVLSKNVSSETVSKMIRRVQDMTIQPILGTPLYVSMLNKVEAGTVTGVYQTLLNNYIVPCMAAYVEMKCFPHITFKARNSGVGRSQDPEWQPSTVDEVEYLRDEVRKDASFYKNRMIGYLLDNKSSFPEYDDYDPTKAEQMKPEKQGNSKSFMFVKGNRPKC